MIRRESGDQIHKMLSDGAGEREIGAFLKKNLKNTIFKLTRRNPLLEVQILEV
jgi:hypothetical protein